MTRLWSRRGSRGKITTIPKPLVIPAQAGNQYHLSMQRDFSPTTYLLASVRNGTLYIGVTSNLMARIHQHREGTIAGFTDRYRVKSLVWFEQHATMEHAIVREMRLKKWNRDWKLRLIEQGNPEWRDLAEDFGFPPLK